MSERFLIVRMSAMGDVVQSTPVARGLKAARPDCHITWLINTPFAPLLYHNPHVDEILTVPRRPNLAEFVEVWWQLKQREFTTTIDLQCLLKSAVATLASGAPRRIGREDAREFASFAYNEMTSDPGNHDYVSQLYLEQCHAFGVSTDEYIPDIFLVDEDYGPVNRLWAEERLDEAPGPVIAMVTFSAQPRREWPEDYFVALADRLTQSLGARIIIPGTAAELERAEALAARMAVPPIVFAGQTALREAAALLERADMVIGADSGLTHLAYAVRSPVVSIIGPSPVRNAPTGPLTRAAYIEDIPCRPCRPHQRCDHRRCMRELTPEIVAGAAEDLAASQGLV